MDENSRTALVPAWLDSFVDLVGRCIEAHAQMGPLAFRWCQEEDFWNIAVYPTLAELVGGKADGTVVAPGFSLDVKELSSIFDEVIDICWRAQAFGPYDSEGPHISIEGTYDGHEVYLQVLSEAPDDEPPSYRIDLTPKA